MTKRQQLLLGSTASLPTGIVSFVLGCGMLGAAGTGASFGNGILNGLGIAGIVMGIVLFLAGVMMFIASWEYGE